MHARLRLAAGAGLACAALCGQSCVMEVGALHDSTDTGNSIPDAGAIPDSGSLPDASRGSDTGGHKDAGRIPDGGGTLDAGAAPDVDAGGSPGDISLVFQDYNAITAVPLNKGGDTYPSIYTGEGSDGTVSINTADAITGHSIEAAITAHGLYLQWNANNGTTRGFAREYVADPGAWRLNTYDRMSFWIKVPTTFDPLGTGGQSNGGYVGTYVKQLTNPDDYSDETGGNHYYHTMNLPNHGRWTHVILNMHPSHYRGETAGEEPGVVTYPTATNGPNGGDDPPATYNYFDTLTRFYINLTGSTTTGSYLVDDILLYKEPAAENDVQVYSITGTYDEMVNELIVTWSRPTNENDVKHEVRYAFSDVHALGWDNAAAAPNGVVTPLGWQGYNGMVYDSTALPLAGHSVVYVAIKPQGSTLFSQIPVRLDLGH